MRRSKPTYNTEDALRNIYKHLQQDIGLHDSRPTLSIRKYVGPMLIMDKPYVLKRHYQLKNFFKRVITSEDPTFEELSEKSLQSFKDSQGTFGFDVENRIQRDVLKRASSIVAGILGEFSFEEFSLECSFGRKAAVKLPFAKSYLDNRVNTLNGSKTQLEWFKALCCVDIHLHRAVRRGLKTATIIDCLKAIPVPKSFKEARIIAPDTTLGGFISRGLGRLLRVKLEEGTHIDLSTQQDRHKMLALRASIDGYLATLDMSNASNSFVWKHIEATLPPSWHSVLRAARIATCEVAGETIELQSFMLMGSGHTFPLQTLLFYAYAKATLELLGSSAKVDVYGDDIIIPAAYAREVIHVYSLLGFSINTEKSFTEGPFRESCGGDYHSGIDVRPFMPEHICTRVSKNEYLANLHSWYNGLLTRWTYEEVPETVTYILTEIMRVHGRLNQVPSNEPDYSGLYFIPRSFESFCASVVTKHSIVHYYKLVMRHKKRRPAEMRIYYWYWLAGHAKQRDLYDPGDGILDKHCREPVKGQSTYRWVL